MSFELDLWVFTVEMGHNYSLSSTHSLSDSRAMTSEEKYYSRLNWGFDGAHY